MEANKRGAVWLEAWVKACGLPLALGDECKISMLAAFPASQIKKWGEGRVEWGDHLHHELQ